MTNDNIPGEDIRRTVLKRLLQRIDRDGFTPALLHEGGADICFPGGLGELMSYWTGLDDAELESRLKTMDLQALPVRQRIRTGVLARFDIIRPHKEAGRKTLPLLLMPAYVGLGTSVMWNWADIVWRAAGDTSTDLNYYSKRGILAGVASSTLIAWYGDDSEDEHRTAAFLDARLENVMAFERLKAQTRKACSGKAG